MASSKTKKFLIYTIIFIPFFIIIGEVIGFGIYRIFGNKIRASKYYKHPTTSDLITGANRFKLRDKFSKNKKGYVNKHGLIKTIHTSDSSKGMKTRGILITGNSVSMGYPLIYLGDYQNSFVNNLERSLREKDDSIDILNLSFYGFNSWQENIQVARYFNSETNHIDLPSNIELIASVGGIQDFWGFIDFLHLKPNEFNKYYFANGFMSLKGDIFMNNGYLLEKVNKSLNGNILSATEIFTSSIINFIKKRSYLIRGLLSVARKYIKPIITELDNKRIKENLDNIIQKKIKITLDEYQQKKKVKINSVVRNIKSISSFQTNPNVLFVYLPTKFTVIDNEENSSSGVSPYRKFLIEYNLNAQDLNILEKDYRDSLLEKLSKLKGVKVSNLSKGAKYNWFYDESHFSKTGQKKIADKLLLVFQDALKIQ